MKILAPLAVAALLAGGCGNDGLTLPAETDEPLYREGQQLERQGRTQEALNDYLKLITKRGDQAAESHLEVGLINLYHIKDPIAAIYHFTKYLELQPNSKQAVYVRGLIDSAKRDFARSLPAQPLENVDIRSDSIDQVEKLQRENQELKAEIASLRESGSTAPLAAETDHGTPLSVAPLPEESASASPVSRDPLPSAPAAPPAPSHAVRTHTVTKGDTLYSLAQHYYGNRSRWRDILSANRDQLPSSNAALKIGMVVKIP